MLFERHASALDEESILKSSLVFELVVSFETRVKLLHAERHALFREFVNVGSRKKGFSVGAHHGRRGPGSSVLRIHRYEEGGYARRLLVRHLPEDASGHRHTFRERGAEFGHDDRHNVRQRNERISLLDKASPPRHQFQCLDERHLVILCAIEFHGIWATLHAHELFSQSFLFGTRDSIQIEIVPRQKVPEGIVASAVAFGRHGVESMAEEVTFLGEEPSSQVFGAAVGSAQYEVGCNVDFFGFVCVIFSFGISG
mmetsp:Transcript_9268/g.19540  ORF Transcript_9268/g.19540 Transcript_9268/m.19540 type:complete len:255 (+) Transcript_9268:1647-2411(+)